MWCLKTICKHGGILLESNSWCRLICSVESGQDSGRRIGLNRHDRATKLLDGVVAGPLVDFKLARI